MTDSWAHTRGRRGLLTRSVFLILLLVVAAACASTQQSAQTTPARPEATDTTRSIEELQAEAEGYFDFGAEAYRRGEYATAQDRFQRALDVYLGAQVNEEDREALQVAFNDLFNRVHALQIEGLINPDGDSDLVLLDDEELPAPSEEDLALLRSRLEVSPPALPKFSMPIPSPLDNDRVAWAMTYLSGERKEVIEEGLSRATSYMPMIEAIFDEVGVPRELAWSALIESLFKTGAYSRAAAVGMWQFVSGTARLYGLKVGNNVDERKDPVRSTRMAAIYMRDLYQEFGDWSLVLAAYNAGKGRLARAMQRTGSDDFWALDEARALPRETRDHVPKIYAAILIATDPEYYGFHITPQPLYAYDESVMEHNTDLRLIAELSDISFDEIRELNPHITAWVPEGYPVRIPAGSKATFEAALAEVPPGELLDFVTHVVARGDTLSGIAAQYPGTNMSAIVEVNNLRNPNRLSIGQRLQIPVGPPTRQYRAQPVAGFSTGERTTYTVRRGDSLYDIAQSFRTDIPNLMRWNNLTNNLIFPGDELIVYYGVRGNMATPAAVSGTPRATRPAEDGNAASGPSGSSGTAPAATRGLYTVRRGDSLYEIAQRYDVSVDELKSWNNHRGNTIYPGDKLVVYSPAVAAAAGSEAAVNTVRRYTVSRGDSPYLIAQRYNVDLDALLAANGLTRRSSIYPGDELLIPSGGTMPSVTSYTVRRGDTLGTIAERHGISLRALLQANGLSSRSVIYPGDTLQIPGRN